MESQPKNPEFRNNPENFHPWTYPRKLGLKFGLSFQLDPYFAYASSEGSGAVAHMGKLQ